MILNINNPADICEIKKYGKAKDILLLNQYFEKISPYTEMIIIDSISEWNKIIDKFPDIFLFRADCPIGKKVLFNMPTNLLKTDIPQCIIDIKKVDKDGVLLLLNSDKIRTQRHKLHGGFNVSFEIGKNMVLEFVGKGFDGRELTKGIAVHESYSVPWSDILFVNSSNINQYNIFNLSEKSYLVSYDDRKKYLQSIGVSDTDIEENLPKTYIPISDDVIDKVLDQIVITVYQKQAELQSKELSKFAIAGNIDIDKNGNYQIIPFGVFRGERIIVK